VTIVHHTAIAPTDVLGSVKQVLTNDTGFHQIAIVSLARVPILTCECNGITIDVSVNNKHAVDTTEWVNEHYDACMKNTLVLLKYWFVIRRHNNVYTGGLGAYALALMLYAAVCMTAAYTNSPLSMLNAFFSFWANWHCMEDALDVATLERRSKKGLGRVVANQPYLPCITDPMNKDNDVTKQAYDMPRIQHSMQQAAAELRMHGNIGELLGIHTQTLVHYDSE